MDSRSLLRFLVPAHFGNPPNVWSESWGFKGIWFLWSFPLREQRINVDVIKLLKRHLPGRELEQKDVTPVETPPWSWHTSTITMDNEYMSDSYVACPVPPNSSRSGAQ